MCGRYFLDTLPELLQQQFRVHKYPVYPARYNIRPGTEVSAIRAAETGNEAFQARWGLIPAWAKDEKIGYRMINARSETAAEKPAFRSAFRQRRCLLPASGLYEWQQRPDGKQPIEFLGRDGPLGLAGLWERWRRPEGEVLQTVTILTTTPNALVAPVHDRMPVIIAPEHYQQWLSGDTLQAAELLQPANEDCLDAAPLFEIRPICVSDDAGMARVIRTVMPEFGADGPGFAIHDPEVAAMTTAYQQPRAAYFVVIRRGEVVGGAGVAALTGADEHTCELRKMYILPRVRGFGVGRQLIALCLQKARDFGYRRMYLETLTGMEQAQKLYLKAGFKPLDGPLGQTGHFGCNRFYARNL